MRGERGERGEREGREERREEIPREAIAKAVLLSANSTETFGAQL